MRNRSKKSIAYPANWTVPKFHLGQLTTKGPIVGVEYLTLDCGLDDDSFGEGWGYWIITELKDIQKFPEECIELLAPSEIKELIEARAAEIEILKGQLNFAG